MMRVVREEENNVGERIGHRDSVSTNRVSLSSTIRDVPGVQHPKGVAVIYSNWMKYGH